MNTNEGEQFAFFAFIRGLSLLHFTYLGGSPLLQGSYW